MRGSGEAIRLLPFRRGFQSFAVAKSAEVGRLPALRVRGRGRGGGVAGGPCGPLVRVEGMVDRARFL